VATQEIMEMVEEMILACLLPQATDLMGHRGKVDQAILAMVSAVAEVLALVHLQVAVPDLLVLHSQDIDSYL